jgi:hypothetical protein
VLQLATDHERSESKRIEALIASQTAAQKALDDQRFPLESKEAELSARMNLCTPRAPVAFDAAACGGDPAAHERPGFKQRGGGGRGFRDAGGSFVAAPFLRRRNVGCERP